MMRIFWFSVILLISSKCSFAQAFSSMVIQFIPSEEGLWALQSLSLMPSTNAVIEFPLLKDEKTGSIFFSGSSKDVATQGQVELEMIGKSIRLKTSGKDAARITIRSFIPYENFSGALIFTPTFDLSNVIVSVKRERSFFIQIRPLMPYDWKKDEEDMVVETMTSLGTIRAGQPLRISVLHMPKFAKTMKISGLVVVFLSLTLGVFWLRHAG